MTRIHQRRQNNQEVSMLLSITVVASIIVDVGGFLCSNQQIQQQHQERCGSSQGSRTTITSFMRYQPIAPTIVNGARRRKRYPGSSVPMLFQSGSDEDDFSNFAESLLESNSSPPSTTTTATATTTTAPSGGDSKTTTTRKTKVASTTNTAAAKQKSWQDDLDELLDVGTPLARRQILLSDLLNANEDIRASVQQAIKDRKIDPLLTPTGKKIQEGTRAVARQLTNDIIPQTLGRAANGSNRAGVGANNNSNANNARSSNGASRGTSPGGRSSFPFVPPPPKLPLTPPLPTAPSASAFVEDVSKVGNRIFNALQNQVSQNIETLRGDLADPSRIPGRLTKQTEAIVQEAGNIFAETPAGLKEPKYEVIITTPAYEIRQYDAYNVATTNMAKADEMFSMDNVGQAGAAFNSLAAYLFGANREEKVMEMTTPVTTTMMGEMRFYLGEDEGDDYIPPDPLERDEARSVYETGNIIIQRIQPALLAVRRFSGFVTDGEITRQKEQLLAALSLDDDVDLDVPHGQTVPHVIFQYNPPYTIPVIRRNEIAVPVLLPPNDEVGFRRDGDDEDARVPDSEPTTTETSFAAASVQKPPSPPSSPPPIDGETTIGLTTLHAFQ